MRTDQLEELVRFLPALESLYSGGEEKQSARQAGSDTYVALYPEHTQVEDDLVRMLYEHGWILHNFNWPEWKQSDEAGTLRDDEAALAKATPEQLARLLTVVVRQDRFVENGFRAALESGLVVGIVRRAAAILDAQQ